MRVLRLAVCMIIATLTVACAHSVVVNTGESPSRTQPAASPSPTGRSDPNLVDAHEYYVTSDNVKGYYFTTPSGKWICAIIPHSEAGCQAAGGGPAISILGGPDTVEGPDGAAVTPNAIAVNDDGEPGFTWLDPPGFSVPTGKAMVLDFNKTLAAAGFRCNVAGSRCVVRERDGTRRASCSPLAVTRRTTPPCPGDQRSVAVPSAATASLGPGDVVS